MQAAPEAAIYFDQPPDHLIIDGADGVRWSGNPARPQDAATLFDSIKTDRADGAAAQKVEGPVVGRVQTAQCPLPARDPRASGSRMRYGCWREGERPLAARPFSGNGRPPKLMRRDEERQPVSARELALNLPPTRYLSRLDTADRQEPTCPRAAAALRVQTVRFDLRWLAMTCASERSAGR